MSSTLDDALRAIVREVVREEITSVGAAAPRSHYDQNNNPLGKRRFLEAARRGSFPSTKQGKLVLAPSREFDAWLASRQRGVTPPRAVKSGADALSDGHLDELLAKSGVRTDGVASRRRRS